MANIDISKVKGIIFDYGGTLDSAGDHWSEIIWDGYNASEIFIDKAQFREAYVFAERELARTLHILPQHNFHDLLLIKIRIELQWLSEKALFPPQDIDEKAKAVAIYCYDYARNCIEKIRPTLDALKEKYPMVLVSNFYGNIATVLKDFAILDYFQDVIESAVVGVRKPDPRIFLLGCKALNLAPQNVLVVGDSYKKDILPAESIGCQTAWLKGKGWTAEEMETYHPNTMHELGELLVFLEM